MLRLAGMLVGFAVLVGSSSASAQATLVRLEPGSGLPAAELAMVDDLCRAELSRLPGVVLERRLDPLDRGRRAVAAGRLSGRRIEWSVVTSPTASGFDVSLQVTVSPYESSGTASSLTLHMPFEGHSLRDIADDLAGWIVSIALPRLRGR